MTHLLLLLLLNLALVYTRGLGGSGETDQQQSQKRPNNYNFDHIGMPTRSYFSGFDAPDDAARWERALQDAKSGKQVLLRQVLETIRCPGDLATGEKKFKWLHRITDVFVDHDSGFEEPLRNFTGHRAPIVMMGYKLFDRKNWEGSEVRAQTYIPKVLLQNLKRGKERFPRKAAIYIGGLDENWGWLSTHFLNRTASWGFTYSRKLGPFRANQQEEIAPFLDDPRVIMLLVNQHHNVSHPKVISLPRGILPDVAKVIWDEAQHATRVGVRKDTLLFVASSNWGPRPMIIECVRSGMKGDLTIAAGRMDTRDFMKRMSASMAVLCVPGLGYDTFRLWETLASGSMPVLERGVGFDRTLYKLPALLVDDFADLTSEMVKQAYVEALYRASLNQWDYKRITTRWWERLLYKISETKTISHLSRLHPIFPENSLFARPMVPFDCVKIGGCGPGTKRVPKRSCAIDFDTNFSSYNWYWEQNLQWPYGYPIAGHHLYGLVDPKTYIEPPEDDEGEGEGEGSEGSVVEERVTKGTTSKTSITPPLNEQEHKSHQHSTAVSSTTESESTLPRHRIKARAAIKRIRKSRDAKISAVSGQEGRKTWQIW